MRRPDSHLQSTIIPAGSLVALSAVSPAGEIPATATGDTVKGSVVEGAAEFDSEALRCRASSLRRTTHSRTRRDGM
jgi:hypothetical protein